MKLDHIFLAPEAIFPIVFDEKGERLNVEPATNFPVAGTLQGEGKMAGVPVLFIRTAGCNLRCMWSLPNGEVSLCDTPFASFDTRNEKRVPIETARSLVLNNMGKMNHVVISGGEPFIQSETVTELIKSIRKERSVHFAIETNGSLFDEELVAQVDFFSISPKLINSVPTKYKINKTGLVLPFTPEHANATRKNISAIQEMIDHCNNDNSKDFQLKFVVQNHDELVEIEETFLTHLRGWKPDDVVLMPLGSTTEELEQTRMVALEAAIERGWRYSPRLQITYFGGVSGV